MEMTKNAGRIPKQWTTVTTPYGVVTSYTITDSVSVHVSVGYTQIPAEAGADGF